MHPLLSQFSFLETLVVWLGADLQSSYRLRVVIVIVVVVFIPGQLPTLYSAPPCCGTQQHTLPPVWVLFYVLYICLCGYFCLFVYFVFYFYFVLYEPGILMGKVLYLSNKF